MDQLLLRGLTLASGLEGGSSVPGVSQQPPPHRLTSKQVVCAMCLFIM